MSKNNNVNKNLKNNLDSYFSDDDVVEEEFEDNEQVESEDEMDDYTRKLIYEASARNLERMELELKNFEKGLKKSKQKQEQKQEQKQPSKKQNQVFSLGDFNKKVDAEMEAKKPKKFVSKRVEEKKKQSGVEETNVQKRHFNPRFPPYNFVHQKSKQNNNVNLNSKDDFPSL